MKKLPCGPCFEFEPSLFEPGVYLNIKCIGKLPGPTNEFERSLVLETGEFEGPKFDCTCICLRVAAICDCASRAFDIGTHLLFKTLVHQSDDLFSFPLSYPIIEA